MIGLIFLLLFLYVLQLAITIGAIWEDISNNNKKHFFENIYQLILLLIPLSLYVLLFVTAICSVIEHFKDNKNE